MSVDEGRVKVNLDTSMEIIILNVSAKGTEFNIGLYPHVALDLAHKLVLGTQYFIAPKKAE